MSADHFARPLVVANPDGRGVAGLVTVPECRVCGRPIEQRQGKHAAPGAWQHVEISSTTGCNPVQRVIE